MTLAQANLAQDTTVCCNIGTRFQTQMATPPALVMTLAQETTLAQAMTLAQDTTVCCNIGLKFLAMRLIQNTNGFQTQMATPLALVMNLAQEMTLAQANLAQDTTICCNIGLKFLSVSLAQGLIPMKLRSFMKLRQNTNGFQTQMATPPAQENLAQEMTLA